MAQVLLQVQNGVKCFGSRVLFEHAQLAINEGEHIGVIGPNGAGKTTLFRCLTKYDHLDSGLIIRSRALRLGYLAQEQQFPPGSTPLQLWEESSQLPLWEVKKWAQGLGLNETHFSSPLENLSGGYRMRCLLVQLMGQQPNLLLLDEPTNYLDLESLLVLEQFLQDYPGSFLLISHDREFLRRTTDHTLEIEGGQFTKFNGHIDDYFEQKKILREQLTQQALSQAAQRKTILDFAARFGAKATKARQVQSRLKRLEKMSPIELTPLNHGARIPIAPPPPVGKVILTTKKLAVGYEPTLLLSDVELILERNDHVGIVGVNGAGKTSLLKVLAGKLKPLSGTIQWGPQVQMGYYAQHVAEDLNLHQTIWEALQDKAHPDILPQQIKDLAGALLFSGDDINKKIHILSGGEKARVALGQILLQKSPLLILDEPTNHLDFMTVEALTQALELFSGAILTVSHDRSFIKRVAKKILEVKSGQVLLYPGTYEEYVWSQQKGGLALSSTQIEVQRTSHTTHNISHTTSHTNLTARKKNKKAELQKINKEIELVQKNIADWEKRSAEISTQLHLLDSQDRQSKTHELAELVRQIQAGEEKWLLLMEQKEQGEY